MTEVLSGLMVDPVYVVEDETDPNDFELRMLEANAYDDEPENGEFISGVFDSGLNGMPGIQMYRAWVHPDIYPNERQPVLSNWSAEDKLSYCGIQGD